MRNVKLTDQQIKKLKESFEKVDTNHDGFVEPQELKAFLESLGQEEEIDDETVQNLINNIDENGDHKINFQEFISAQ